GVASEVGQDMTDGPVGKQRRLAGLRIGQLVQRTQEGLVGSRASGDITVELASNLGILHGTGSYPLRRRGNLQSCNSR
ncbi:MAG: hypothetical protein JWN99_2194, partial [Ilumatobacteraceae bacterium]|nr:hypothetical protein [Ilumatobacteraceae bacterium]